MALYFYTRMTPKKVINIKKNFFFIIFLGINLQINYEFINKKKDDKIKLYYALGLARPPVGCD